MVVTTGCGEHEDRCETGQDSPIEEPVARRGLTIGRMTPDPQLPAGMLPTDEPELHGGASARDERESERGQGMIEYCLIVVLIGIFVILTVQVLGHHVNTLYSNVSNGLSQ
jgi:Flp pilus assembly pilin Flp